MLVAHQLAGHLYRRAAHHGSHPAEYDVPSWTGPLILVNLLVFLPLWLFVGYTVGNMFPTLAMVEDENAPPPYEPLATTTPIPASSDVLENNTPLGATKTTGAPRAVTSSLRLTTRLIRSQTGGPRAFLRGLAVYLFTTTAFAFLQTVFSLVLPPPLAPLAVGLAALALVQFSTTWVHTVITPPSPLPFWRRLPPFRRAFDATVRPTLLVIAAHSVGALLPIAAVSALDMAMPEPGARPDPAMAWKSLVLALALLVQVFLTIPAEVILTRIQASLLPPDHETIVPFDRTFAGAVEPEVVSGRGYATVTDAWKTFSREAWRRLVVLYAKIVCVTVAAWLVMAVVVVPQVILVVANSTEKKN